MGSLSVAGITGDYGKISLGLGLAALVVALWNHKQRHVGVSVLVSILGAAVAGLTGWKIYDLAQVFDDPEFLAFASPSGGIYLSLLGGLAVVVSAFWTGILSRANERAY